jgi:hypothetical protein
MANNEIVIDATAAPANAFFQGTPTNRIGGAIMSVRSAVQPASFHPDPVFRSRTPAMVR